MSVKISIDGDKIVAKMDNLYANNMEMLASQILRDCNRYCKEDTGMLIMSSLIHSRLKQGLLVWRTPYAARQYYEIKTAHPQPNPNASWRWCEVARNLHQNDWTRQAKAIARLYG